MSGIAADFAKRLKDDYFAGHWGNDLLVGLMWCRDGTFGASKSAHLNRIGSPTQYLVPSWSQLSQPGTTSSLRDVRVIRSYHPAVEYLVAHTTKKGKNPFGAIDGGELRVRGYFMSTEHTDGIQCKPQGKNWANQILGFCLTFERSGGGAFSCDVQLDYDLPISEVHEDIKSWKWILLGTCKMTSDGAKTEEKEDDEMYPFGLLVHRIKGSGWCRIGTFYPDWHKLESSKLSLQTFFSASKVENITII